MINFETETETKDIFDFDPKETALTVVDAVLLKEGCPKECVVEILLTDAETVREINKEYRNIDKTTDVLSFPNVEWDAPANYGCEGFEDEFLKDPETGLFMLGQIVLCKERILSQAEEYGHGIKREFAFLTAHSMLHLLGYDHMEEEEARIMESKQREYLEYLGITR